MTIGNFKGASPAISDGLKKKLETIEFAAHIGENWRHAYNAGQMTVAEALLEAYRDAHSRDGLHAPEGFTFCIAEPENRFAIATYEPISGAGPEGWGNAASRVYGEKESDERYVFLANSIGNAWNHSLHPEEIFAYSAGKERESEYRCTLSDSAEINIFPTVEMPALSQGGIPMAVLSLSPVLMPAPAR